MKKIYLTIAIILGVYYLNPLKAQDEHQRGIYLEGSFMFAPLYQVAMHNGGLRLGYQFNSKLGVGIASSSYRISYNFENEVGETCAKQLTGIYYRALKDRWIFSSEVGLLTKPIETYINGLSQQTLTNSLYIKQEIGYAVSPSLSIGTFFNYVPHIQTVEGGIANKNTTSSYFHPSLYAALNLNKTSLSLLNNKFSNRIPYIQKRTRHINAVILENTEKVHLHKLYADTHIGWFDLNGMKIGDADVSIGFQKRHFSGLGVGMNYMSTSTINSNRNYSGIGLQYRYINDWIVVKTEVGKVMISNFSVTDSLATTEYNYQKIQPNRLNYYIRLNSGIRLGNYVRLGYSLSYLPNLVEEKGVRNGTIDEWTVTETPYKPVFFSLNIGATLPISRR